MKQIIILLGGWNIGTILGALMTWSVTNRFMRWDLFITIPLFFILLIKYRNEHK